MVQVRPENRENLGLLLLLLLIPSLRPLARGLSEPGLRPQRQAFGPGAAEKDALGDVGPARGVGDVSREGRQGGFPT